MPNRFLPTREAALDDWLGNFQAKITAAPGDYGLSGGDAVIIKDAFDDWHAAFDAAASPATRTGGTVIAKREQKSRVLAIVRRYANAIRADAAVSRELQIDLGLHVRSSDRIGGGGSPIPTPPSEPVIALVGMRQGSQDIRIVDGAATGRRAKPAGTVGAVVFRAIGDSPATRPEESDARFLALVTRGGHQSQFQHADRGRTATYFARWVNFKGELGPWSRGASMTIAA